MRDLIPFLMLASIASAGTPLVSGINRFTTNSYQELSQSSGNLIFSSFNIATSLSMALAGAHGATAAEMSKVLCQNPGAAYNTELNALIAELLRDGNGNGNELASANNVWVQQGFPVLPAFQQTMLDLFHAPSTPVDFRANAEAARQEINRWTAERTKDRIQDLFPAGSLSPDTRMVLTSAIYFYGKWQSPFKPSETHTDSFQLEDGGKTDARFMTQTAHFGYTETPAVQILEMRYGGTPFAFDVLLPKQAGGLKSLEKSLTPENLGAWFQGLENDPVEVYLPKFRAESSFALAETLGRMGMPTVFTREADFSGIDGRRDLFISGVLHKAFVDVSEAGTEAAAATGTTMRIAAVMRNPKKVVFRADHPFVFVIRDTKSGAIVFAGRLMKPNAT